MAELAVHPGFAADPRDDSAEPVVTRVAVGPLLQNGDVVDEVERAEPAVVSGFVGQVAEAPADPESAVYRAGIEAERFDLAVVGGQDGRDDPQQCRLARAVRPEESG